MRTRTSLLAFGLAAAAVGCGARPDPAPTVALAELIRGSMTLERAGSSEAVGAPARVEQGATVATGPDGRGTLVLDTGAWLLFDRDTAAVAELGRIQLSRGRVWVDASSAEETAIETPQGSFASTDAAFAVAIGDGATTVYCGSGEVTYRTPDGDGRLARGETLVARAGAAPAVRPEAMWDDWTGGLADPARGRLQHIERVGVLAGRRTDEVGQARTPLPIRGHEVNVTIRGDLAITEVVQTFFNARSDTLEGEWAMRLPPGAIVQGFSVDTGAGFADGVVRAVGVGSGYEPSWARDSATPSKLTWDGPERLRARVYPIEAGATVRVRVRWTQWLDRRGARRTYVYPMRPEGDPPLLGEFVLTVDTSEAGAGALRAGMGAQQERGRVVLRRSDYRARADFYLDLYDAEPTSDASRRAIAYRISGSAAGAARAEGEHDYVLFDLPTEALGEPSDGNTEHPLELVLLLDVSGATDPEDLEIARGVVEALLRQLAPTDRVAIRLADVAAHPPPEAPEGLVEATPEARERFLESIARVDLGGATDLGASLREAAALVAGRPRGAVVYLGDALPTTGALDATSLRASLAALDAPPRFFGLAIGDGANVDLLRAVFGEQADAVRDREGAARAIMRLLADAARPTLRGVTVDLGEGVERVYPRAPITLGAGEHLRLVGRLVGDLPSSITVRGSRDGATFETEMPVVPGRVRDEGDVRRRWATERLRELLDEDAGREALVELGMRFGLVTPWTSLVVGVVPEGNIELVQNFDHDPLDVAWGLGGGGASVPVLGLTSDEVGWRRRLRTLPTAPDDEAAPESTWTPRVGLTPPAGSAGSGDGGLARAAVERALAAGERGPRQCYERRALVRPDLAGEVTVRVVVQPDGSVREAAIASSSLRDPETEGCVLTEVRGIRFPAVGGQAVTVEHTLLFQVPERELGTRRQCSDASRQVLELRRALWRERLAAAYGTHALLEVWRQAQAACELSNWRARRTLLDMMLARVDSVAERIALYRALGADPAVASYLRRAILRSVRTPADVEAVRSGLGLDVALDWSVFARLWWQDDDPARRLALVRRWLEVAPDDLDLRLRLLSLLEQTRALPEARRIARELRADPLADARVRTAVGEFWLRQGEQGEARRVFSEIVEHAPLDPWARRRLGDLYRAHGWSDDAYREYQTLAHLRPGEGDVLLLLARAAADAGRVDEALRLEQRLSEATEPGVDEGAASSARLWTMVRLARLEDGDAAAELRDAIRRRWREAGALREPPDVLVLLAWDHPDDAPRLRMHWPDVEDPEAFEDAPLGDRNHGIWAFRIAERGEGEHVLEIVRDDRDAIRDTSAELVVIVRPGAPDMRILRQPVTLTRQRLRARFRLGADDRLEQAPVPPERGAER